MLMEVLLAQKVPRYPPKVTYFFQGGLYACKRAECWTVYGLVLS